MVSCNSPPLSNVLFQLTAEEWNEIRESSVALFTIVGIFEDRPNLAESGGLEALKSVQLRLDRAVSRIEERLASKGSDESRKTTDE